MECLYISDLESVRSNLQAVTADTEKCIVKDALNPKALRLELVLFQKIAQDEDALWKLWILSVV